MDRNERSVSSLSNALKLLNLFTVDEPEWALVELSEELEVGTSTIYRLTDTLIHEGFLVREPLTKVFRLGSSLLQFGQYIITSYEICEIAPPILEKLVRETGETVHLSILEGTKTTYLQVFECLNYINIYTHVGKKNPAHCTSTGQVILAYQNEENINRVIEEGLPAYSDYTITKPSQFRERLNNIKVDGFSFNKDEMNVGVSAIAAPVISPSGKVEFAVSIAGPNARINTSNAQNLAKLVKNAADELSEELRGLVH